MKRLTILIVFFIVNTISYAQVANDYCSTAQLLTVYPVCYPVSGTLLYASTSSTNVGCSGNSDVFYKFVAPASDATITVTPSSGLDVIVSVFENCNSSVSLYCADSYFEGTAETIIATGLTASSVYYIKVQSYSYTPATYTFNICVINTNTPQIPLNDECAVAQELTPSVQPVPVAGTLLNATVSSAATACYGSYAYHDVFYKFKAVSNAATITVAGSSGLDVNIGLLSGCGNVSMYCMDYYGYGGTELLYASGLTVGATYYIKVQTYDYAPSTYTFNISVQSVSTVIPANDNCANAIYLTPAPTCNPVSGELINAAASSLTGNCLGNHDVFYKFDASAAAATVYVAPSSGLDVSVNVFSSCTGGFISCSDAAGSGGAETLALTGLVENNTYIVQVQTSASTTTSSTTDFTICVIGATPAVPVNDECAGAIEILPSLAYTPVTGTTRNATKSTSTPSCTGNSDVFYKFTATSRTATITVVGSSGFDPVIGLFHACGTSSMDCADFDYNTGGTETLNPAHLTVGDTYYIKVQDYSTTLPTTPLFTIALQSAVPVTGTDASANLQQISFYPNPTQNTLNIENIQMETTLELIDIQGRVLLQKHISADGQIDVSEFTPGIYILKLSADGAIENRRVVIQ